MRIGFSPADLLRMSLQRLMFFVTANNDMNKSSSTHGKAKGKSSGNNNDNTVRAATKADVLAHFGSGSN